MLDTLSACIVSRRAFDIGIGRKDANEIRFEGDSFIEAKKKKKGVETCVTI